MTLPKTPGYAVAGGLSALAVAGLGIFDIVAGSFLTGGGLAAVPPGAEHFYALFARSPLLGLYFLDLLNAASALIGLPFLLALAWARRRTAPAAAGFVAALAGVALAVFLGANQAMPMWELGRKYAAAGTPDARAALAAAGEALLARGAHGSLGAFPGFLLSTAASLAAAVLGLGGRLVGKALSWTGVAGMSLLLAYVVAVAFVPAARPIAVALAAPGGLAGLAWTLGSGLRLLSYKEE
jgi:hypothetical protein